MNRFYFNLLIAACTCFSTVYSYAEGDSTASELNVDSSTIKIYISSELNTPYKIARYYDFEVDGFQQYQASNNLLRTFNSNYFISGINDPAVSSVIADLGTIGSPGKSMIYRVNTKPGLDFGFHSFDHLKFQPEQTLYYNVRSPFTDLYYALGPKEEEVLSVLHTQNINPLFNAGFNYQLGGVEGIYSRQISKRINFRAFTSLDSKNKRYHLNAQAIWNELRNEQSGGISQDSLFEDTVSITKKNIPVRLGNASSAENQQIYEVIQRYDFGKSTVVQVNDSVTEINFDGKLRIYHSALLNKGALYYSDINPDTSYYPAILLDSNFTGNKVHYRILTNTFGLVTLDLDPAHRNKFNGGIAGVHEYIKYNRYNKDTVAFNGMLKGFISNSAYAQFYWKLSGDYTVEGINADDYRWELSLRYENKKRTQYLDYLVAVQQRAPAMIHYLYEGNHYRWKNDFLKQHNATMSVQYTIRKHNLRIGLRQEIINRLIFYNGNAVPQQDTNEINIYSVHIEKDFNLKHLSYKIRLQYQYPYSGARIKLPSFISSHSVYYHNFLFKKALYMQIGFDLFFYKDYYAYAYAPSTQQFYLQYSKSIGNYPYLDFFINLKINQAKIFVKMSHVNQEFMSNTYYSTPHYPRNDMAFVVGISWRFYD